MKKITTLNAVVLITAIVLPSCKKDWTCVCTDNNGTESSFTINNSRKPEAKLACEDLSFGSSCKLK